MMKRTRKLVGVLGVIVCTVGLLLGGASLSRAASLQIDANGILTGATGVNVGGTLYDVQFVDGTCIALFSGCDNALQDFTFNTSAGATLASQALLDQVFLNVQISGQDYFFDSNPRMTSGCEYAYAYICHFVTPYQVTPLYPDTATVWTGLNSLVEEGDGSYYGGQILKSANTADANNITWARWQVASVPEPSSVILLASGLVGLAGYRWRQRPQAGEQVG